MILKKFFSLIIFFSFSAFATLPMSERCQEYHRQRKILIEEKDKALALQEKSQDLVARSLHSDSQTQARIKLTALKTQKKNFEIKNKIKNHEEIMIRKGCPGLALRGELD